MAWPGTKLMLLGTGVTVWVTSCLLVMYRSSGGQWVEFAVEQPGLVLVIVLDYTTLDGSSVGRMIRTKGQLLLFALSLQGVHCK